MHTGMGRSTKAGPVWVIFRFVLGLKMGYLAGYNFLWQNSYTGGLECNVVCGRLGKAFLFWG